MKSINQKNQIFIILA